MRCLACALSLFLLGCGPSGSDDIDAAPVFGDPDARTTESPPDAATSSRADAAPTADAMPGIDGAAGCSPDSAESEEGPYFLGEFSDDGREETFSEFNLHASSDADGYAIDVIDDTNTNPTPNLRIDLQDIPEGHDYRLRATYECDSEGAESTLECQTGESVGDAACESDASGSAEELLEMEVNCEGFGESDETGTMTLAIDANAWSEESCAPYELRIEST